MPAFTWDEIPDEPVRPGVRRRAFGTSDVMLVPAGVEQYIEPTGDETVENIDVFAPARADYLHLLEWLRAPSQA